MSGWGWNVLRKSGTWTETGTGGSGLWTCGMHPEVIQDEPGICPICHMDLTPFARMNPATVDVRDRARRLSCGRARCTRTFSKLSPVSARSAGWIWSEVTEGTGRGEILFYRNPMDPGMTSPEPRKDEMGMDYVPVYATKRRLRQPGSVVTIDPSVQQNMNVITQAGRAEGHQPRDPHRRLLSTTTRSGWSR